MEAAKHENVMYLSSYNKKLKSKQDTSGNKVFATYNAMQHLEKIMVKNGATIEDIMLFDKDFLEANGIAVPKSFFTKSSTGGRYKTLVSFIDNFIVASDKNLSASKFYEKYCKWCVKTSQTPLGKQDTLSFLRANSMLSKTGTVDGVTVRNVLLKTAIAGEVN